MGSNHLLSTALQNETIIAQLPEIDICFWDFQNHAKNGGSVPLTLLIWSPIGHDDWSDISKLHF